MKIVFDISSLGNGFTTPVGKRGVYRVVEAVLEHLLRSSEGVMLSATENTFLAQEYLNTTIPKASGRLLKSARSFKLGKRSLELSGLIQEFAGIQDTRNRSILRRGVRWLGTQAICQINSTLARAKSFEIGDSDIFHQPGPFPLSRFVKSKRKGFSRFLSLYDFIPFTHPEFTPGSARPLKVALQSLSEEDNLICISNYVREEACERLKHPPEKIFVAPLAASREIFFPCNDLELIQSIRQGHQLGRTPYFLSLCALDPRKNVDRLISSFAILCKNQPTMDAKLVLAGSVSESNRHTLLARSRALGIAGRIVLTGFVPDDHLSPLYAGALAFVFLSLAEGFGLPPLEAMQCGTPVISSNLSSLPEVVADAGILLDPNETDCVCQSMWDLYQSEEKRKLLSESGVRRALGFSWDRCAADHINAYKAALSRK